MRPKLNFRDIPQFTGTPNYKVSVPWARLPQTVIDYNMDLDPDFQRGHVWTPEQQTAYVEFRLRGGMTGHEIYFNNPDINLGARTPTVIVDGKQRMKAVMDFMEDKVEIFGGFRHSDIENMVRIDTRSMFLICINNLNTRAEVLRWYLELNTGGVVHTEEELERVHSLLLAENQK